jgi:hypothetical protein
MSSYGTWCRSHVAKLLRENIPKFEHMITVENMLTKKVILEEIQLDLISSNLCDSYSQKNIWLIKPVGLSCGEKICVEENFSKILEIIAVEMNYKCVVQKYIERPLLVRNNQKFDIRQWVLVTSINPFVIYGFSECYLRLSGQQYTLDSSQLSNVYVHLCNNAIQRTATEFQSDEKIEILNEPEGNFYHPLMMTQTEFSKNLFSYAVKLDHTILRTLDIADTLSEINAFDVIIRNQMKNIASCSISSVRDKLEKVGRGYEWLGFDFMVTDQLQVKLLEINTSPDTSYSTPITEFLVKHATKDLLDMILIENLTTTSDIIACKGQRFDLDNISPRWELWSYAPTETKSRAFQFGDEKVKVCGELNIEHTPRLTDCVDRVLHGIQSNFNSSLREESEDEF